MARLGHFNVAGIDEVGRGALAGPVVAGAVIMPLDVDLLHLLPDVRDSKQLTALQRTRLDEEIRDLATAVGIGLAQPSEIDKTNIRLATLHAMNLAVRDLDPQPSYLLIDREHIPQLAMLPQRSIKRGDQKVFSIAAGSIVAKVWRDRYMANLAETMPGYGFEKHKGYGTKQHLQALKDLGPSMYHRMSFKPVIRSLVAQR